MPINADFHSALNDLTAFNGQPVRVCVGAPGRPSVLDLIGPQERVDCVESSDDREWYLFLIGPDGSLGDNELDSRTFEGAGWRERIPGMNPRYEVLLRDGGQRLSLAVEIYEHE